MDVADFPSGKDKEGGLGMKIALIGANGQLGSDIVRVFEKKSHFKLIPLVLKDMDVTNHGQVQQVLGKIKPEIVINTAAYHQVDEVEGNPQKAFEVNAIAEKNLAQLCEKNNWVLVFISTDYVFGLDEKRKKLYTEVDLPGPINVYGISKLAGEAATAYALKHFIIRTCGLFGVSGPVGKGENFIDFMIRLAKERGKIKVVDDQILTPTWTFNLAENLHELLKTKKWGLYHMVSKGACSRYEFVKEALKVAGVKASCGRAKTTDFPTPAKRPLYSALKNANLEKIGLNLMNPWQRSLRLYLKEKGYLG